MNTALTVAGFDPSGGAGVIADVLAMHSAGVHGLSVCTALTFKNEAEFEGVKWIENEDVVKQIEVLLRRYSPEWLKIGLVKDSGTIQSIVSVSKANGIKVLWDPILSASAGFVFHDESSYRRLEGVAALCDFLTLNSKEAALITGLQNAEEACRKLSENRYVLLKGGHRDLPQAEDVLFRNGELIKTFTSQRGPDKHGTGCIL